MTPFEQSYMEQVTEYWLKRSGMKESGDGKMVGHVKKLRSPSSSLISGSYADTVANAVIDKFTRGSGGRTGVQHPWIVHICLAEWAFFSRKSGKTIENHLNAALDEAWKEPGADMLLDGWCRDWAMTQIAFRYLLTGMTEKAESLFEAVQVWKDDCEDETTRALIGWPAIWSMLPPLMASGLMTVIRGRNHRI